MNNFKLLKYINDSIKNILFKALKNGGYRNIIFIISFIINSKKAFNRRSYFEKHGKHIPSFLIASITNACNLACIGCYAENKRNETKPLLTALKWRNIFNEAKDIGINFCLLAGGETLIRKDVIKEASKIKEIIFPIFTNGTLIDKEYIKIFGHNKNLIPILSIEGDKNNTDKRRGTDTYDIAIKAMDNLEKYKIFFGTSITVTKENINEVTSIKFIENLNKRKCKIIFFIEYVPVDIDTKNIAFTIKERKTLEEKEIILKAKYKNIIFISFPGDEKHMGGCLAGGRGFLHINSYGDAEACPFAPYSDRNLTNNTLFETLDSELFKKIIKSNLNNENHTGGCALFENKEKVKNLLY